MRTVVNTLVIIALCSVTFIGAESRTAAHYSFQRQASNLTELSEKVSKIQTILEKFLPASEIFVGAGSARALIDQALTGADGSFRDLDIQVLTHQRIQLDVAERIQRELRDLPFHQPSLVGPERDPVKQIFLHDGTRDIDVTFFQDVEALDERGIFTVDLPKVRLARGESLHSVVKEIARVGAEKALAEGWIRDPVGGYRHWRDGVAILRSHAWDVEFPVLTVRAARTLAKLGTDEVTPEIRALVAEKKREDYVFSRRSWAKAFMRLLADERPALALRALSRLGGLGEWSATVQRIVSQMSIHEIQMLVDQADPLERYEALVRLAPESEQDRLVLDIDRVAPQRVERHSRQCSAIFR